MRTTRCISGLSTCLTFQHGSTFRSIASLQPRAYFASARPALTESDPLELDSKWLSKLKSRVGACITFGLNETQIRNAAAMLQEISRDWRELVAGSEGFLTQKDRRGLWRHKVLWGDMDSMGHVNNVMYNRYAESGRVLWANNFAKVDPAHAKQWNTLASPTGIGMILKSIKTDFKFPMTFPDRVTVLHKLRDKPEEGADAFVLDVILLSERHQRVTARCVEDVVIYDYMAHKKIAMRPFMLEQMNALFRLQEQARKLCRARAHGLMRSVERLERESWDQPDAKEDFGSAKS